MTLLVICLGMVLTWDALRRFAERNDQFDPEDYEELVDKVELLEKFPGTLVDLKAVLTNHAHKLGEHETTLTKLSKEQTAMNLARIGAKR